MTRSTIKRGLGPLTCPDPRVLILGSLPGDVSIRQQQYYAHPQNQFWRLLAAIFDAGALPTYDMRVAFLAEQRIAVWDVLAAAKRDGSLDSAIRNGVPNDIAGLLDRFANITIIACNGQTAHALFRRHVAPTLGARSALKVIALPSTSPAATQPMALKIAAWRKVLRCQDTDG